MAAPWALGAQARIVGEIHGQSCINVLHFATNTAELDVVTPSPLLLALVAAIVECAVEALLPAVTSDYKLKFVDARFVHNAGGSPINTDPVVSTVDDTAVGELSAASVSFASSLVNLRTGLAGKSGRGKMFLPPPGEGETTAGVMSSSVSTALVAFLTCLAGKFLGTTPTTEWRWGVFSKKLGGTKYETFDSGFFLIGQMTPSTQLAVISRRKKGHGR